ncbi:MAG: hypothetical protein HC919_05035 [Oscillatoriales cyanobacterium SM2_2_1]|nr:hypothetical protein [Oscillatoriales cyanobacterium SM2_2_1]
MGISTSTPRPKKFLGQVCAILRVKHYICQIKKSSLLWIRRFIRFHHKRHPKEMGGEVINAFLTHLAMDEKRWRC